MSTLDDHSYRYFEVRQPHRQVRQAVVARSSFIGDSNRPSFRIECELTRRLPPVAASLDASCGPADGDTWSTVVGAGGSLTP
ncbi:MAG TPA: hypothetical protein VLK30_14165 [Candidatus Limnocylindrales bacterium]|nr:hypothetical protein [Candidatus Limnocylindrales bacterium]